MLNARDKYYSAAYEYGKMEQAAKRINEELSQSLERANAMELRQKTWLSAIRLLEEDLKQAIEDATKKPWWKFW
jgi:hypothetical protein